MPTPGRARLDVHFQDDEGRTALCWAAMVGNEFEVRLLLTEGADPLHKDKEGHNALFYAIRSANKQATKLLVEYVNEQLGGQLNLLLHKL
ncbi:hypothetical protein GB937_009777 [Aspergillus fischeri]|nr:hypothetical protein GB937_009777 [Aspergillus fischeri]